VRGSAKLVKGEVVKEVRRRRGRGCGKEGEKMIRRSERDR
jgi:hypothetical protein